MSMTEIWKDIPGFEGQYQASSLGRVRSLDRQTLRYAPGRNPHYITQRGRVLAAVDDKHGYLQVGLGVKCKSYKVHRLIALTFLGPRPSGADIRHLNGDRYDNRLENLAYGTRTENNQDIYLLGGKQHVFTSEQVLLIRQRLDQGERICDLTQEYNVNRESISRIKSRKAFAWL